VPIALRAAAPFVFWLARIPGRTTGV